MYDRIKTIFWWDISKRIDEIRGSVICIGNFDGIHGGHQEVIKAGKEIAGSKKTKLCVITFVPHPRFVFRPEGFFILTPISNKIKKLEKLGVHYIIILNFSQIKEMSPYDFCFFLQEKLSPCGISVGADFSFGKGAKGKPEDIKNFFSSLNVDVKIVPLIFSDSEKKISSSFLRNLIKEGKVWEFRSYTGDFYSVKGCVVKGEGRGKTLGFPTANISTTYFLPQDGVYACFVKIDSIGLFKGVCNVGPKPTFGSSGRFLEVFILGFEGNIYLKSAEVFFVQKIRDVFKFQSVNDLKERIMKDVQISQEILSKIETTFMYDK
ncbi:MAG: riboflavin biosynthesis protein RibF [Candidatus Calescibacterium sp.]|jgi:riboflavin kinase/FMN adenylyltransferase